MAVAKRSVSFDSDVMERAQRAAAAEGISLSAWLNRAAAEAADAAEARAALDDYVATYGEPEPADMDATRAELADLGFGRPETSDEREARAAAIARLRGLVPDQRSAE